MKIYVERELKEDPYCRGIFTYYVFILWVTRNILEQLRNLFYQLSSVVLIASSSQIRDKLLRNCFKSPLALRILEKTDQFFNTIFILWHFAWINFLLNVHEANCRILEPLGSNDTRVYFFLIFTFHGCIENFERFENWYRCSGNFYLCEEKITIFFLRKFLPTCAMLFFIVEFFSSIPRGNFYILIFVFLKIYYCRVLELEILKFQEKFL